MNNIFYALIESFRTITKQNISKFALLSGIGLALFWTIIGFFIWHPLIDFTAHLLDFVPFALIKDNGVWMFSSIVFIQAIFISFAFIIIIFSSTIIKDSKKQKYPLYILSIAFSVIFFWAIIWYANHASIHIALAKILTWFPFKTIEQSISYIFAIYILYSLFIISLLFFVSFFSEKILNLGLNYNINKNFEFKIIKYTLKDSLIYLIASIVLFPLLFIPIINFFAQILVWMWLGKDTITFDIGTIFYDKENIKNIKQQHKFAIWFILFAASFFNLVPLLNIFSPYFGEFAMYYYLEGYKKDY